jgi:hypothetical protein
MFMLWRYPTSFAMGGRELLLCLTGSSPFGIFSSFEFFLFQSIARINRHKR